MGLDDFIVLTQRVPVAAGARAGATLSDICYRRQHPVAGLPACPGLLLSTLLGCISL